MVKQKKVVQDKTKNKAKAKKQFIRNNSDDDDEVEDMMAWGNKKQNYYREDEQQYSELSQQQQQAKRIYENQFNNYMNDEDLYDIPTDKKDQLSNKQSVDDLELQQEEEAKLPVEYVKKQLEWVFQLFRDLEFYQSNELLQIYQTLLKSYLAVLISIKDLDIPYIQYHPIIPLAVDIKTRISKLMKRLTVKEQENQQNSDHVDVDGQNSENVDLDQDNQDDDNQDEQQQNSQGFSQQENKVPQKVVKPNKNLSDEHEKGLYFYNEMKNTQNLQKKQKKAQKKIQRQSNKLPAFKQVVDNQGRFASQLILKNKGLMKKRKKIQGNSRVKLRKKYQKKKAIHRAQSGHLIRQNPGRAYQGQSNIKMGKIAGVRLK